jgi:hypothetical protein
MAEEGQQQSTRIFTRFYIPFVLSLLVLTFVFVLIRSSPGLSLTAAASLVPRRASTNYS